MPNSNAPAKATARKRHYSRESEHVRREALLFATQHVIAQYGLEKATVRAIAEHAGVTQGLIRHYFGTKEVLVEQTFERLLSKLGAQSGDALAVAGEHPNERLAMFLAAVLSEPLLSIRNMRLWLNFLPYLYDQPHLQAINTKAIQLFENKIQSLIAALDRPTTPDQLNYETRVCNTIIRGLRLEYGLDTITTQTNKDTILFCLQTIGTLLGIDLTQYHAKIFPSHTPAP